jgi:pimeloyl-ACP methyl ester carboxylesterase
MLVRTATLAAATIALAGCGGGGAARPAPPPLLSQRCSSRGAGVEAETFWFNAADGTRLDAAEVGSGERGVILLHEAPADLCDWAPYAKTLARRGFHVLLVDLRGYGLSRGAPIGERGARADVRAAVEALKARGARKIALVGASYGGATAMVAAPSLGNAVAGVASLGGELVLHEGGNDELNALDAVRKLHVPFLVLASKDDHWLLGPEARTLVRAAASRDKQVVVYPGYRHGWDLLYKPPTRPADTVLGEFLRRVTE